MSGLCCLRADQKRSVRQAERLRMESHDPIHRRLGLALERGSTLLLQRGALKLLPLPDFFPIYRDTFGRFDGKPNTTTRDLEHLDSNVVADDNGFRLTARENEHDRNPFALVGLVTLKSTSCRKTDGTPGHSLPVPWLRVAPHIAMGAPEASCGFQ